MSVCPICDRNLGKKRGANVIRNGEVIGYSIIWVCEIHGETKSKAELMAMGQLNRVVREATSK